MINLSNLSPLSTENLSKIDHLLDLEKVHTDVTFLGARTLTVNGCEGVADLHQLALSLIHLSFVHHKSGLSHEQKKAAASLSQKVYMIYKKSDEQIRLSNCISRLFAAIREWWADLGSCPSMRWYIYPEEYKMTCIPGKGYVMRVYCHLEETFKHFKTSDTDLEW